MSQQKKAFNQCMMSISKYDLVYILKLVKFIICLFELICLNSACSGLHFGYKQMFSIVQSKK